MRQLFPDLVLGAVGSSAPVEAKLDFYGKLLLCGVATADAPLIFYRILGSSGEGHQNLQFNMRGQHS